MCARALTCVCVCTCAHLHVYVHSMYMYVYKEKDCVCVSFHVVLKNIFNISCLSPAPFVLSAFLPLNLPTTFRWTTLVLLPLPVVAHLMALFLASWLPHMPQFKQTKFKARIHVWNRICDIYLSILRWLHSGEPPPFPYPFFSRRTSTLLPFLSYCGKSSSEHGWINHLCSRI